MEDRHTFNNGERSGRKPIYSVWLIRSFCDETTNKKACI